MHSVFSRVCLAAEAKSPSNITNGFPLHKEAVCFCAALRDLTLALWPPLGMKSMPVVRSDILWKELLESFLYHALEILYSEIYEALDLFHATVFLN
jgi:hypothetical protein